MGHKNQFIKGLISDAVGQGNIGIPGYKYDDQWWLGAHCRGPHGEKNWGDWSWDHSNTTIEWFDWMGGEPNDWHRQRCLTFLKNQDIFGFGVYHWNDWGCDYTARYICEKAPMMPTTAAPEPETTAAPEPETAERYQQFPRVAKYLRRGLWN